MSDQMLQLGDVVELQTGFPFKSAEFASDRSGVRLLRGDNIAQGRTRWENAARWTRDDVDECYQLREGDVVLAMDRPWIGAGLKYARITRDDLPSYLVQRVARLRAKKGTDQRYLTYLIGGQDFTNHVLAEQTGTAIPHISGRQIQSFRHIARPISEQRMIAQLLGALDDKIATNAQAVLLATELSRALHVKTTTDGMRVRIADVARSVTRGVTPKYTNGYGLTVINQKCVRDHWIDLRQARTMDQASARPGRMLKRDDLLVNSTGQGTLGRVARWTQDLIEATVDSHITIVRFDASVVDPTCAGVAMLEVESQIEALAEGSTGQTELRRDLLGMIELRLPTLQVQHELGLKFRDFDNLTTMLRGESARLAATRDELLPLLMSGKIRVRDAERQVEDAL